MSHVLAEFDPIRSQEIYQNCSHQEIAENLRSKHAYNKVEDE